MFSPISLIGRLFLIVVQRFLVVTGLALTLLTIAGQMSPALLLTLTFLPGVGSILSTPAYQASIPDLVPRSSLVSASALGSINVNLARAVGPAIAGLLIEQIGVGAVFALNTATFLFFVLVVAAWHPPRSTTSLRPERLFPAIRAGGRYVRFSPPIRRILLRLALFLLPASALWALLPLVASQRLGLGANGYGLQLGAVGLGAVVGALLLPRLRTRFSDNALLLIASSVFAVALAVLVLIPSAIVILIVLIPTGIAWILVLSSLNSSVQLFLPAWVRARGLSIYQMVLYGTQTVGSVIWGSIAGPVGLVVTLLIAAVTMLVGIATIRLWPLLDTSSINRDLTAYWSEPELIFDPESQDGPVLVTTTYTISSENEQPFLQVMSWVRRSRLRTGAISWELYRDGETAHSFVEYFVVLSWEEHLRQHNDRQTGADREHEERATALSDPPPHVLHLLAADVSD